MRDTIDMAREWLSKAYRDEDVGGVPKFTKYNMEVAFAAGAAAEREACAKVCDEQVERSLTAIEKTKRITDQRIYRAAAQTATWNAAAIRARSCPPCNEDCDQGRKCPARGNT